MISAEKENELACILWQQTYDYVSRKKRALFRTTAVVLRLQKLRTPLVGARGYQSFPLFKLGVGM